MNDISHNQFTFLHFFSCSRTVVFRAETLAHWLQIQNMSHISHPYQPVPSLLGHVLPQALILHVFSLIRILFLPCSSTTSLSPSTLFLFPFSFSESSSTTGLLWLLSQSWKIISADHGWYLCKRMTSLPQRVRISLSCSPEESLYRKMANIHRLSNLPAIEVLLSLSPVTLSMLQRTYYQGAEASELYWKGEMSSALPLSGSL